jgi:hypothetical protein
MKAKQPQHPNDSAPVAVAVRVVRRWLCLEDWQNVPAWTDSLIEEIEEAIRKLNGADSEG